MTLSHSTGGLSPRLGSHLSIVTMLFVAVFLLSLTFAELGTNAEVLRIVMIAGPAIIVAAIGILSYAGNDWTYRTADRRVPGAFAALGLATSLIGATGLAALTGSFFFLGHDAVPYALGLVAGLVISAVLIQPYVRKDGALTLAGFTGRRFESRLLRLIAGLALSAALILMLAAELKLGITLAASALGADPRVVAASFWTMICVSIVTGGLRSLSWTGAAGGMLMLIALIVPVTLISILLTNLPVAQLSYGVVASDLTALEMRSGIAATSGASLLPELAPVTPVALGKPFFQAFGAQGTFGSLLIFLLIAAGIAAHPLTAQRASAAASVLAVRRMMAWSVFVAGLVMLTLPAIGVFARRIVLSGLAGLPPDQAPAWFEPFAAAGWLTYDTQAPELAAGSLAFARDAIILMLPVAAGLPGVFFDLALAGLLAAALVAASAHALALASILGEDILFAWQRTEAGAGNRLTLLRGLGLMAAGLGCWMALSLKADPFELYLWGLAIAGGSMLVPLAMSVWWKRVNGWGALAAVIAGLSITGGGLLLSLSGAMPAGMFLAAALALPAATALAAAVSLMTPAPEQRMLDVVRDMRVPGGETLLDRELRLARASLKRPV